MAGLGIGFQQASALSRAIDVERRNRDLKRFEALSEGATDVNSIIDADGRFQYVTPLVTQMLGYDRAELVGEEAATYVHPEDRDEVLETFLRDTSPGERSDAVEFRVRHADGSWVPLEGRCRNLLEDPAVEGIVTYTTDLTERKAYERELEQYKTIAETASDVIVTIDEESRIQTINGASEDVFGYDPDALVGESLTLLMPERLRERYQTALGRYVETGQKRLEWEYVELPGRHVDGSDIPLAISFSEFEQDGERYFAGILRDITDRKELEDSLRRERDIRARIFETSPTGIVVVDPDGTVSFLNHYAAELLDAPAEADLELEELLSVVEITTADGEAVGGTLYRQIRATGESVHGVERHLSYPSGEQAWVNVNGAPLEDPSGGRTGVVFTLEDVTERKRYENHLVSLNELARALTDAETDQDVAEAAVETATMVLSVPHVQIAYYDEESGSLETAAQSPAVSELVGNGSLFASNRGLDWQVFSDQDSVVSEDLPAEYELEDPETALRSAMIFPLGEKGVFVAGTPSAGALSPLDVSLANLLVANVRSALDRVQREQTVRQQRDTLADQNEALERVQRINSTIRGITTDLIEASNREGIVQSVCDRLAGAEAYSFVWFGTHDPVDDEVRPEAWAGLEEGILEAVTTVDGPGGETPTEATFRTGEPEVWNNLAGDPPFEGWRQAALESGFLATIAVPVRYGETTYGVLNLYAEQRDVFDDVEAAVLQELGGTVGYALNALARRQALVSESAIELEFLVLVGTPPLFRLAAEHDAEVEFTNIVQGTDGLPRAFVTIRDVPSETVLAIGDEGVDVHSVTLVTERDDEALYEVQFRDSAFVSALIDHAAMPLELSATGEEGTAVIRIPQTSDVRTFVSLLDRYFEEVELVRRREVDEPVKTQEAFEAEFRTRLTDRQEEILQTAFAAGFFDSPRKVSAQDLAEALDVTQPTVSRHIRAGERKLFELLFGEEGDDGQGASDAVH
jgi:PAS domain S-box-containing protein